MLELTKSKFDLDSEDLDGMSYEDCKNKLDSYYGSFRLDCLADLSYHLNVREDNLLEQFLEYPGYQYGTVGYKLKYLYNFKRCRFKLYTRFIYDRDFYCVCILDGNGECIYNLGCCYIRGNE